MNQRMFMFVKLPWKHGTIMFGQYSGTKPYQGDEKIKENFNIRDRPLNFFCAAGNIPPEKQDFLQLNKTRPKDTEVAMMLCIREGSGHY